MEGNCKRAEFLEKNWKEIAKELGSCKRTGRKLQKSWVPAKELEGNCKRAGFLQKNWKEIAKELGSCKRTGRKLPRAASPEKQLVARSSARWSIRLLSRGSQVRVLPGLFLP